ILAKIEANAAGADDAVLLDAHGFVAETNATHVFLVAAGAVRTPTTRACPEGITRGVVLELCGRAGIPVEVTDVSPAELRRADEAFVTGTMGELAPVVAVDGSAVGDGRPGPVTARLTAAFAELTRTEGVRVVP